MKTETIHYMMCTDNFGKMKEMKYNETHQADALASSRSHAAGSRFLRRAAASLLMLFTFGIGSVFATDYVFVYNNHFLGVDNNGSVTYSTELTNSCIWTCTSNRNTNPTVSTLDGSNSRYLYTTVNGNRYWLKDATSNGGKISVTTSTNGNYCAWLLNKSTLYTTGPYNLYYDNGWKTKKNQTSSLATTAVVTKHAQQGSLSLSLSGNNSIAKAPGQTGISSSGTFNNYFPPYISYSIGGTAHYWYVGSDHNSAPSQVYDLNGCDCVWSLEGDGASYASLSDQNNYYANLNYNTTSSEDVVVTVRFTANGVSATKEVTLKGGFGLFGYFYIRSYANQSYYLKISNNKYGDNWRNQYYLRTATGVDDNAIWALYVNSDGQYWIKHVSDGKYVASKQTYQGEKAVYLGSTNIPDKNDNTYKFTIPANGQADGKTLYNIIPVGSTVSFNPWTGNPNDIGIYNANDNGSKWILEELVVANPVITANATNNTATITCSTAGATIYYTTDGTDPTKSSNVYSAAFSTDGVQVIKAFAVKQNHKNSEIVSLTLKETVKTPVISFSSSDNKVTISCDTEGAAIVYSIDGGDPTTAYPNGGITISGACTVKAKATKADMYDSEVASLTIGKVATPVISEDADKNIVITCSTEGATIYYKTAENGQYTQYSNPFPVNDGTSVWAYAAKTNNINSDVTAPYEFSVTITAPVIKRAEGENDKVEITVANGGTIHYTTNGTNPTASSPTYNGPITLSSYPTTVKAIATGWGQTTDVVSVTFNEPCAIPVIVIDGAGNVTITCATAGASIYYTTDETTPVPPTGAVVGTAEYTAPFVVEDGTVVKAIAVKDGNDNSSVASAKYNKQQVPTPEINIVGDRVWFTCQLSGVKYYYTTNGSNPTTSSTFSDGSEITITGGATIKVIATHDGYSPSEVATKTKASTNHIVYLDFNNGDDNNDGTAANKAKKTWAGAYIMLGFGPNAKYLRSQWAAHNLTTLSNHSAFNGTTDADFTNTVDNNIIYLVGDVSSDNFDNWNKVTQNNQNVQSHPTSETNFMQPIIGSGFFKPVTISGKYATSHSGYARINVSEGKHYLNEDTRFEYVEFYGTGGGSSTDLILNYYDIEMGKGIRTQNFTSTKEFDTYHHGYKKGVTNTAHFQFYGGLDYDTRFGHSANSELEFDNYLPHPYGYKIIIRSGYFSTISPGSTQWEQYDNLNGAMGSPNTPVKCTILIDIDRAWNDSHKANVLKNQGTQGDPNCDVAVAIAGVHEGNMYGDQNIIIKSGRIYRVVNGTFGANYFVGDYPADSYFGRANILVDPREPSSEERTAGYTTKNSLVVINELYGGGLGRFKSDLSVDTQSSTYFYGKSTVTINGGTFLSAIYASGAGGVNGIGDDTHHTPDTKLPYWNGSTITYGNYEAWKSHRSNPLLVKCRNSSDPNDYTMIDIAETSTRIEIHGGVFGSKQSPIEGIFGGGYGFVDKELIDYDSSRPNVSAGSIFAAQGETASSVLIDGDAVIYGNVYGAGRGDGTYYSSAKYDKANYNKLGLISGNVDLTIGGNAQILGNVYGAGLGIENNNFLDMARLYGNTTITVTDNAYIKGGVYGGGKNGSIDGDVELSVLGNAVIGTAESRANVHGGGYGKQTRVNGNVDLTVGASNDGLVINGDVYGGSALGLTNGLVSGQTSNTTNHTNVTLNAGTINGSLYGGGLGDADNAANVYAPVSVKVYGGSVKKTNADDSGCVYGANNVNGAPQNTVTVDIFRTDTPAANQYAIYSVYGGGNKAAYIYSAGPKVTVHNCDNSIEYVYGGGNAASVAATDVTIYGGNIIGNVFGGGNGTQTPAHVGYQANGTTAIANASGNTSVKIYGGTITNVFGGSNSQGKIKGTISVTADETAEAGHSACLIDVTNLYGGGNQAASNAGTISIGCADHIGNVYGGSNDADITGNINLSITAGHIDNVFGGNNTGHSINGTITVTVNDSEKQCGMVIGNVYGGGNMAAYTNAGNFPSVNIVKGTITGNVFGGGLGSSATVTANPQVAVSGGSIAGSVFGGGSQALTTGNTTVGVTGGTVSTAVYGGGALANVSGNTTVNLTGGKVKDVYGGGLGRIASETEEAVAAKVGNATVNVGSGTFDSNNNCTGVSGDCVITGTVFGCNNLNGTPTGNAIVNVYKTNVQHADSTYHVNAVYGGGNKAAYDPEPSLGTGCTKTTRVEIFRCDNSVRYVYGGGNAASVPATNLIIHGGDFDYVFGGGNGKTAPDAQEANPGANVGYYVDVDDNDTPGAEYGTGKAETQIHDGTINHLFGGSNTKGNIRYAAITQLEHAGCDFFIGEAYAAGNEAYMNGTAKMIIGCIPGMGELYGGARKANINNDVQITITNGTYGQVFGGNNLSGTINGTITINIEETGCDYIVIGEVYGGGNQAPYSAPAGKEGPTINAYSFTKIGKIYGGGLGADAIVTGDTHVNVQELLGTPTGQGIVAPTSLGIVGDIFGGGNAAPVVGRTFVKIGTASTVPFISVTDGNGDPVDKTVLGANIQAIDVTIPNSITGKPSNADPDVYHGTGNVYGGGNAANVTGKTNVQIGNDGK